MKTSLKTLSVLILVCATVAPAQNASPLSSIVDAELSFARTSVEKGMDSAFISFLSQDAILFRPHPVNGQDWFRSHPAPPILLTWTPGFADVAVTGELGYTTGPWTARNWSDTATPPAHGEFVTIWRKRSGQWKVVLDHGVSHPAPASEMETVSPKKESGPSPLIRPDSALHATEWSKLLDVERRAFGDSLRLAPTASLISLLSKEARVFRPGHFPLVSPDSIRTFFDLQPGTFFRRSLGGDLSRGADLAYTYGSYRFRGKNVQEETGGYYLTIWKKGSAGGWNIVLDLESVLPKKQ